MFQICKKLLPVVAAFRLSAKGRTRAQRLYADPSAALRDYLTVWLCRLPIAGCLFPVDHSPLQIFFTMAGPS